MKTNKKMLKSFDARQKAHQATIERLEPKKRAGYKRPGSRNPRNNGC